MASTLSMLKMDKMDYETKYKRVRNHKHDLSALSGKHKPNQS